MKLKEWVLEAKKNISSLDAELIAMKALDLKDRVDIVLYSEDEFDFAKADEMLEKRKKGFPLAYITGEREFFGRTFSVDSSVLIPRPETEDIILSVFSIIDVEKLTKVSIADIGTGSGCIAITLKLELDALNVESNVDAVDCSVMALEKAQDNADDMGAEIKIYKSDLLSSIVELPDIITANLPYVDMTWDWTSPELKYEPALALFTEDGGLKLIKKLIDQIVEKKKDNKKRFLLLEADTSQLNDIIEYVKPKGFSLINRTDFILTFKY